MFCHNVRKHTFSEKNTQVFLTFPSHARCLNIPTFFTLSSFSWKVEVANFPPFSRLPLNKTREKGTFLKIEPFNASDYATHTGLTQSTPPIKWLDVVLQIAKYRTEN